MQILTTVDELATCCSFPEKASHRELLVSPLEAFSGMAQEWVEEGLLRRSCSALLCSVSASVSFSKGVPSLELSG